LLRRLQLFFPLQDARAAGRCFRLRDVAGVLQSDGERGVRQRIVGRKHRQSHGRGDRLVQLPRIAQGTDEAMMRFHMRRVGGDGITKCLRGLRGLRLGEQFDATLRERVGIVRVSHG